jgi:hypothetical protein
MKKLKLNKLKGYAFEKFTQMNFMEQILQHVGGVGGTRKSTHHQNHPTFIYKNK